MYRGTIFAIVLFVLIILFSAGLTVLFEVIHCNAQTASIGFAHKWEFFAGCLIEIEEGIWIPLENWRSFN